MQGNVLFVADTSVLVAFSGVEEMPLLNNVLGRIAIPAAVSRELVDDGVGWVAAFTAQEAIIRGDWIVTVDLAQLGIEAIDNPRIDLGEREVVSLAAAWHCTPLIDEKTGRRAAEALGLRPIGVLGPLKIAKDRGNIGTVGPLLERMIRRSGLRYGDRLLREFMLSIGERWPP